MCGGLRREGQSNSVGQDPQRGWRNIGQSIPIVDSNRQAYEAIFNGHARSESLSQWFQNNWRSADIHIVEYTEGRGNQKRIFTVPRGYVLKGITTTARDGKKIFSIVTRPAVGSECQVHNRFPVLTKKRF